MGDFESPADVADAVQGEAGGSWSYAGRNLHYGMREEGANLPELDALNAPVRLSSRRSLRYDLRYTPVYY